MNWSRARLKEMARTALHGSYWRSVLVSLLLSIAVGSTGAAVSGNGISSISARSGGYHVGEEWFGFSASWFPVLAILGIVFATILVFGIALNIFLLGPLEVSCRNYFRNDIFHPTGLNALSRGFTADYLNVVKTQFLRNLYTFLWGLLLVIPGIVKRYEYRMMPYIQAEHPEMTTGEVFELSRQMMYGEKWNAFVLDLSFLGWNILSVCTFGILGFFYVRPYEDLTNAALYGALKQKLEMRQENLTGGSY